MQTMKAIRIHQFGGPEVLQYESAAKPTLSPNGILVKICAAGVNPVDWKMRDGYLRTDFPFILGWDFAGEVVEVGANIQRFKKGDRVFGYPGLMHDGTYAEYIAVEENELAHMPKNLSYEEAAVVPLSALTAWQALFEQANLQKGQKVLIHAASGGVGHYAVQLAKWIGAEVYGTASGRHEKFLEQLGVDHFIDYTKKSFAEGLKDIDVVFDTVGGQTREQSWPVLKPEGILVSIVDPKRTVSEEGKVHDRIGKSFTVTPNFKHLTQVAELIEKNILHPHLGKTFPLKEAAKAHELSKDRHVTGKIALIVG